MTDQVSLPDAQARLDDLVHRAARSGARVTITDHGEPAAVLVNPQELADLDEALALTGYRAQQTGAAVRVVPHDEARARLGLPRG